MSSVIDLGKAGFGKKYMLSQEDKDLYKTRYSHIAPDLKDGLV